MNLPVHDFHFLRPEWFIALLPLLALVLLIKQFRRSQSGWQSVIPAHLYQHVISGKAVAGKQAPLSLLSVCWALSVVALAGPTWERLPQPVFQVQEGHVVVIDMSLSMRATDVSPDRLTRAKYKAIDLINAIDEGEMGLVAYAGDAFTISPLTSDAGNLVALLPSLSPEIMPESGSDPYRGIQEAAELLQNAGYQQGSIYWITDGVTLPQAKDLQSLISDLPYTVNILGVGTEEGAPIRQLDGQLVKDQQGQIVIPKLRGQQLQALASTGGGVYSKLTADESDIRKIAGQQRLHSNAQKTDEQTTQDGDQWAELGPWLLLLLLPFAAYAFRRGVLLAIVLMPVLIMQPKPAYAQTTDAPSPAQSVTPWYSKPFLNADQQGLKEYEARQYASAADTFKSATWQGAAAYKAGNYEAALDAFSQSDTIDAVYNQGNALAQLGKIDEAISRYDDVLSRDPEHADAKANKALLEKMKQDQEQQKQQQDDQQKQDQQQQDNEQSSQDDQQQDQNNQDSSSDDQQQQNGQSQQSQQDQQNEQGQQDEQSGDQQDNQEDGSSQKEENPQEDSESDSDTQQEQPAQNNQKEEEQQGQPTQAQAGELTDEEKEKMQRLENLMKKIPDDPAFLLKRKMQLEAQQRRRQGPPSNRSEW